MQGKSKFWIFVIIFFKGNSSFRAGFCGDRRLKNKDTVCSRFLDFYIGKYLPTFKLALSARAASTSAAAMFSPERRMMFFLRSTK